MSLRESRQWQHRQAKVEAAAYDCCRAEKNDVLSYNQIDDNAER